MESYGRLASLFVRVAVGLASLWWIYDRLPLAGLFLRRLSDVFASPLSVFVLCHVIVASLIADSGKLSLRSRTSREASATKSESVSQNDAVGEYKADEIVFEDKQVISETKTTADDEEEEEEAPPSESEKRIEISDPIENADSRFELSDEDFNRTVEAFIAKQLKFRREETSPEVASLCSTLSTAINA